MKAVVTHRLRHTRALLGACALALLFALLFAQFGRSSRRAHELPGATASELTAEADQPNEPLTTTPEYAAAARTALFGFVRATSGAPISAATLCAVATPASAENFRRCTTSDRSGRFQFDDLPTGETMLSATARGFIAQTRTLPARAAGTAPLMLTLRAGGATVAGAVSDALGGPVPGAFVVARDEPGRLITLLQAGARGEFQLEVEPGPLTLEASAEAYSRHALSVTAPASSVSIVLAPASTLFGRVEANGAPAEGARVVAAPADGPVIGARETSSNAGGAFELTELPAGRYRLTATRGDQRSAPVWVDLVVGQPSDPAVLSLEPGVSLVVRARVRGEPCREGHLNLDGPTSTSVPVVDGGEMRADGIAPGRYELEVLCDAGRPHHETLELAAGTTQREFELEAGREVRGRVEDASGRAVAGALVTLEAAKPGVAGGGCSTDSSGDFTCRGLAAAEYDCSVRSALGALGEKKRADLRNVEVARVSLRLAASASIRVTLTNADREHPAQVFAQPKDGVVVTAVRAGDELVFDRLPLGEYKVFTGDADALDGSTQLVALKHEGESARVTLSAPKLTSIEGTVIDAAGNPVIDTWVRATSANALLGVYADTPSAVITDDQGRFQLRGLIPGRYDVCTRCDTAAQRVTGVEAGATGVVLHLPAEAAEPVEQARR